MTNHEQCKLAWLMLGDGKVAEAQAAFAQVLGRDANYAAALWGLGWIEHVAGRDRQAEALLLRAVQRDNNNAEAYLHLGIVQSALERRDMALRSLSRAARLDPANADILGAMATLYEQGRSDRLATATALAALRLNPTSGRTLAYLAHTFTLLNDLPTALKCANKAIELEPNLAVGHLKLGYGLYHVGDLPAAETAVRRAIALKPDEVEWHVVLSYILLKSGRFDEGWKEYEWRLRLPGGAPPAFASRRWDGVGVAGQTLLVQGEQGLGDTVQFARYLPLAAQRGLRVIARVAPPLAPLMRTVDGVEEAATDGAPPPPHDWHLSIASLPGMFGTTLETIPAQVPYFKVDAAKRARWMERLAALPRPWVGIAWAGNPKHTEDRIRSVPAEALAPLAVVPAVSWVSLQFTPSGPPPALPLHDFTRGVGDFSDSAALIDCLDLVISVDTAVAHLAGALARPVWTLLAHVGEWRWLTGREDSPWYPTMRLLRQPSRGDWASVVRRVADDLHPLR